MASSKGPGRAPHVPPVKPVDQAARVGTLAGMDARTTARMMDEAFAHHHEDGGDGSPVPGLSEFAAGRSSSRKLRDDGAPTH